MAATKRQASSDPAVRKRGRYRTRARAAPPPLESSTHEARREEWVAQFEAGSNVANPHGKRTTAEALATIRGIIVDLGSRPTASLTEGDARILATALRCELSYVEALGLDRRQKRQRQVFGTPVGELPPQPPVAETLPAVSAPAEPPPPRSLEEILAETDARRALNPRGRTR